MFKTKLEVDKHVQNCLKKINNETERNLRCFSFAKLYFNVGDYDQACRYLSSYLSVKPRSPEGYNLLGKALEKLGKKEAALEAYRTSLQQDPKQNNLVIKVCELLAAEDVDIDGSGARYFCDLAQSLDPNNPVVCNLKERIITAEGQNPMEVSQLLLKELENRPTDVNLRVHLLKHFLQHNMIKEAYKHASDVEEKNLSIFHNSLAWYETFAEVLVRYQRDLNYSSQLTWEFWFLSVSVLDRLAALSLNEHIENIKSTNDYVISLFNLDQMLSKASQYVTSCPDRTLVQMFFSHFQAQLYFHLATLVFKQAKKDLIQFKEASNITLPVLFAAYHSPPPDLHSMWFTNASETRRRLVNQWYTASSFRCSQVGHVLLAAAKDRKSAIIEKASHYSTGMWREQLFKKIFVKRDQQLKISTSYFVSNPQGLEPVIKLPEIIDLIKYDEVAQLVNPDSLHHHIWIALNNRLADYTLKCFEGLQYSIKNLNSCAAETLNVLDIQSFIYCATLCARSKLEDNKHLIYYNQDKPSVLPAAITQALGTLNQSKFLTAAYRMYKNEHGANLSELRLLLIKGIEVVRCIGHHGLDIRLLVTLANIYEEQVKKLTKQSEIEASSARAELYWKAALPLLEKIKNNQVITYPGSRLFEYKSKELSMNEASTYIEKGKLFTAVQLMKKKEYEKALHIFEQLKDPYASFHQSQIYKHMADQKTNQNKENVTSEMRSQNIILLSRARDCLYLTLDRLREPAVDRDHPLNVQLGTEIEKIERLLSRIDPDCNNRNECDGMSDENVSSDNSAGEHYLSTYTTHTSFHNGHHYTPKHEAHNNHSTPLRFSVTRQEARPSPERLDAQLRQLVASRDMTLNNVIEQNKIMVESHKSLLEELRGIKDVVNNLSTTVEGIKTSVDGLKNSVDDLQNVTDIVQEMKKEINELKKDQHKSNQLSDEDLYVLEPDYNPLDYNINSNLGASMAGFNNTLGNMYQHYQGARMANPANSLAAAAYAPGLYPGLYPGLAYYGGLGLPQAGALSFVPPEQQIPQIVASLAQQSNPIYGQTPLNTNLGLVALTGQALSQGLPHSKDSPKTNFPVTIPSTQNIFSSTGVTSSHSIFSSPAAATSVSLSTNKAPPVNVVITSSDPLPTNITTTSQPVLSVTIPPQHIKGNIKPHNYQIPIATTNAVASVPSILSEPPPTITTQSLLSNVAPPIISAVSQAKSPAKNLTLGLQIEKTLDQTFSPTKNDSLINKSNTSSASAEEHDPCPDFKPIVPLPDEVPINTGEESETQMFCERAKLYRHVNNNGVKEWKERGVGNLKILFNPLTEKVRLLMRRDQVHKVCANHFLTKDMTITPMSNNDRAYIWAAHDYADEEMVLEKFCVKFKTAEEAKKFYDTFETAKKKVSDKPSSEILSTHSVVKSTDNETPASKPDTSLGGFVFTSTPTFKPKDITSLPKIVEAKQDSSKSPFANFTFSNKSSTQPNSIFSSPQTEPTTFSPLVISHSSSVKTTISPQKNAGNDDSHVEDFIPTAEFKPVIALPELVDIKTGEENAEVLFEEKAKLFRYDVSGEIKEWKERGVGIIKILKEDTVRLVMRRDQVHKVCCNHQVLKNMTFKLNSNNPKAVVWHAQDFSEGVLTPETFTVRFKTEEQASNFLKIIQTAQTTLDENNQVSSKHHKAETPKNVSFGDKFKPAKGSWECKNCYICNEGKVNHCVACETPKSGATPKKTDESGPTFSFGIKPIIEAKTESTPGNSGFVFGPTPVSAWGNAFKPAEGTWECKTCYIRNPADKEKCLSCQTPKDDVNIVINSTLKGLGLDPNGQKFSFGIPESLSTPSEESGDKNKSEVANQKSTKSDAPTQKFTFGVPAATVDTKTEISGFGDAFKPKPGSWECTLCYIRNPADVLYCLSCENPKDETVPKKEVKGINLETTAGQKFTFGIPATTVANTKSFGFGDGSLNQFSFNKSNLESTPTTGLFKSATFTFSPALTTTNENEPTKQEGKFVFGSPQKHDFEFKPRSPRRISGGQGDESDGSYVEEEEDNIYFKPVIPLPDKVEVKTGEESEDVLYCHRAKLFRYVNGEWKERGIGDIKILKGKDNGKLRVVMRREQVLKLCLNHVLTSDTEYIPKDEKTWLFHAADFSEGEISRDQFCIRFKTAEIAQEFKKAVNSAVSNIEADNEIEEASDNDVEVVFETKVTPEEEQEALKLGLPPRFMSYRQLPDCTCEQCKKDDEYLTELFNDHKRLPTTNSIFHTPKTNINTPSSGDSDFFTPKGQSFAFTPARPPKPETLKDLLQKPSYVPKTSAFTPTIQAKSEATIEIKTGTPKTEAFSFANVFAQPLAFGAKTNSGTPTHSTNIFNTTTSGVFGSTTTSTNLFSSSSSSIFDSNISTPTSSSGVSIFGTPKTTSAFGSSSGSIFGNAQGTTSSSNVLNVNITTTSGGLLSSESSSTPSIFSGKVVPSNMSTDNIFGAKPVATTIFGGSSSGTSLFGNQPNIFSATPTTTSSIFGSPVVSTGSIFGNKAFNVSGTGTLFGNKTGTKPTEATLTFGGAPVKDSTTNLTENDKPILNCDTGLSFASLAAKTAPDAAPAFAKSAGESDDNKPFSFIGAGAPVFSSAIPKKENKKNVKSKSESDEEAENDGQPAEHDPHFEPIIPLPDAIVVSTGEENENVLFKERAKLYRYDDDNKEWKERGIGELKILHHVENNTFRMLLRREQVHKVVLNQLVIPDLDVQPMTLSDKAWMWAGCNYADDELNLEKLAVRFKNAELAQQFKKAIDETVVKVKEIQNNRNLPATVQNYGLEDISSGDDQTTVVVQEEDYDDEDEEDDDEDDHSLMFMKRCTLSEQLPNGEWNTVTMGDLQVYYDPDLYAARISVSDDSGVTFSNTLIGMNTLMDIEKNECRWKAVEWAVGDMRWRSLKASFSSEIAAQEFHSNYLEGINYAREFGIIDEIPNDSDVPNENDTETED